MSRKGLKKKTLRYIINFTISITRKEKLEAFHKSLKPTFERNIDPKTFNQTFKKKVDANVEENIEKFILVDSPDENN